MKFTNYELCYSAGINPEDMAIAEDPQKTCQSWLLRLFESKMFDASMAVHYLFNSKEPGVLSYLGKIFFTQGVSINEVTPNLNLLTLSLRVCLQ